MAVVKEVTKKVDVLKIDVSSYFSYFISVFFFLIKLDCININTLCINNTGFYCYSLFDYFLQQIIYFNLKIA